LDEDVCADLRDATPQQGTGGGTYKDQHGGEEMLHAEDHG